MSDGRDSGSASMALSPKQARFVQEYLVDLNATQAAIRAGYSEKTANVQGPRLLVNVRVAAEIAKGTAKKRRRSGITKNRVLRELRALAFSDHTHFMQDEHTGRLVLAPGAPKRAHAAVSSVKYKTTSYGGGDGPPTIVREVEFRLWNKPGPLELAGKHVGLFQEKKEADSAPTEIHIHGDILPPAPAQSIAQDSTLPPGDGTAS